VLTKDGICTLIDIVIANPTRTNLFPWSCATQRFVAFDATQAKEKSYHNQHPTDQFLPLSIEVFECLHKQVNVFLHNCANAIWSLKGQRALLFLPWFFFLEKISITLQRMQTSSILSQAHKPSYFPTSTVQDTPPISTTNLLQAIDFEHGEIWLKYHGRSFFTWRDFDI